MDIYNYENSEKQVTDIVGPSIFLAGPTVRGHQPHLTSWRIEAVEEFKRQNFEGSLIIPEFTSKIESDKHKKWVPLWELNGLKKSTVILFWIPRSKDFDKETGLTGLIGLTTNWEMGYWLGKKHKKVIYGRPDNSYRNDYPDTMVEKLFPEKTIHNTLENTIKDAIQLANKRYLKNKLNKNLL